MKQTDALRFHSVRPSLHGLEMHRATMVSSPMDSWVPPPDFEGNDERKRKALNRQIICLRSDHEGDALELRRIAEQAGTRQNNCTLEVIDVYQQPAPPKWAESSPSNPCATAERKSRYEFCSRQTIPL